MEEQESKTTKYLIPANVTARFEFFEGFGWYEFKIVAISLLIGTVIFFILGLPKKTIKIDKNPYADVTQTAKIYEDKKVPLIPGVLRAFAILLPGVGSFVVVKKDPSTGMSLMVMIKSSKEFKKKQKRYLYKYNSGSEVK